ncbi:MAG: LysR family transcriptional regulator [Chloroflexi bacterium]|nr:LysR family transcriptional regulator [Chloroflexota bacterium]OJV90099.1 MAG: LysR family transcriptional regulator [Chloroflexi bacterium 54-19]
MELEMRYFEYFVAVAEELNFSRAAERLNIAQPPLSQQIQRLEKKMGVKLFVRTKRKVELTEAGIIFLEEARRTLAQAESAVKTAQRAARGEVGRLVVGFVGSSAYGFLPTAVRTFRERFPDVELTLKELTTVEQLQALKTELIDIGFLRPPIFEEELEQETVQKEPFLIALSEKHPLARLNTVPPQALAHEPFILVPPSLAPGFYNQMISICAQAGFQPRKVQEAIQFHVIVSLVAAGLGIAFVPSAIQTFQRSDVVYRPLENITTQAEIVAVWRSKSSSGVLRSFLEVVRNYSVTN